MNKSETIYLTRQQLISRFTGKDIFIYGTGSDAFKFMKNLDLGITVKGFVDTYGFGEKFFDYDVISPVQYVKVHKKNPIIIMSRKYEDEIKTTLEKLGVIFGQEGYIYNESFDPTFDIESFIRFNEQRWRPYKSNTHDSKDLILIPFGNIHYPYCLMNAVGAANYYAKKTGALIYAYNRMNEENINGTVKKIYESLNVADIISVRLTESQQNKVKTLSEKTWEAIHTWADWNSITIDDIHFGTTILRHMMRHTVLPLDADNEELKLFLDDVMGRVVFWQDFFNSHNVKFVFLADGVTFDGYIRDISLSKGIPTYVAEFGYIKATLDFHWGKEFPFFKQFWNSLNLEEQRIGFDWSKKILSRRITGMDEMIEVQPDKNVFSSKKHEKVLEVNNRTKILICPHIFGEDSLQNGEFLFDNSYISWLTHLGELSNRTPDYDWYLKMHPSASSADFKIIDRLLGRYPKIKKIKADVSPVQLKDEGISVALTIGGTIAYEYPLIGIEVITCGNYPGIAFDFAWNPKTIEEYDSLVLNAKNLPHKGNLEEIYQFYAIKYLYYDYNSFQVPPVKTCDNPYFYMNMSQLRSKGLTLGPWLYKIYMDECTDERHEAFMRSIPGILVKADSWRPDVFYKKAGIAKE